MCLVQIFSLNYDSGCLCRPDLDVRSCDNVFSVSELRPWWPGQCGCYETRHDLSSPGGPSLTRPGQNEHTSMLANPLSLLTCGQVIANVCSDDLERDVMICKLVLCHQTQGLYTGQGSVVQRARSGPGWAEWEKSGLGDTGHYVIPGPDCTVITVMYSDSCTV